MLIENLDPRFEKRPSRIHGKGCFTRHNYRKGDFICKYEGERIKRKEAQRRERELKVNRICHVNNLFAIDGSVGGNGTHYVNHSCEPNCRIQFTGEEILIYALRNIKIGEELTVDYYAELYLEGAKCRCRQVNCRDRLSRSTRFNLMLSQFLEEMEKQAKNNNESVIISQKLQ